VLATVVWLYKSCLWRGRHTCLFCLYNMSYSTIDPIQVMYQLDKLRYYMLVVLCCCIGVCLSKFEWSLSSTGVQFWKYKPLEIFHLLHLYVNNFDVVLSISDFNFLLRMNLGYLSVIIYKTLSTNNKIFL